MVEIYPQTVTSAKVSPVRHMHPIPKKESIKISEFLDRNPEHPYTQYGCVDFLSKHGKIVKSK